MSRILLPIALLAAQGCSEYGYHDESAPETPVESPTSPTTPPPVPGEPVADAGPDFVAEPLDTVTLDATRSHDPAGLEIVAVKWEIVSAPESSTAEIRNPGMPRPTLFLDLAGEYVLSLTVKNEAGVWDSTPDQVVITALPVDGFYVQLSWDARSDLDLHLLDGSTDLFGSGDCNYCNMHPRWGEPGRADDPQLDIDNTVGFGPETTTIEDPADGSYEVAIHYYGDNNDPCPGSCSPSAATVQIYLDSVLAASFTRTLDNQGQLWRVASIDWPSAEIHEIDGLERAPQDGCDVVILREGRPGK